MSDYNDPELDAILRDRPSTRSWCRGYRLTRSDKELMNDVFKQYSDRINDDERGLGKVLRAELLRRSLNISITSVNRFMNKYRYWGTVLDEL